MRNVYNKDTGRVLKKEIGVMRVWGESVEKIEEGEMKKKKRKRKKMCGKEEFEVAEANMASKLSAFYRWRVILERESSERESWGR